MNPVYDIFNKLNNQGQLITKFKINGKTYSIYDVDKIEGKDSYIGETRYEKGIILIEKGSRQNMIDTLRHELAHVWLYENGHPYQSGGCFTYEDLCEYISFSNESIYKITQEYLENGGAKIKIEYREGRYDVK